MASGDYKKKKNTADHNRQDRLAPHFMEAERAVLGSIMLESSMVNQATEHLQPDDFYLESHRTIFRAFVQISERTSSGAIDFVTLKETLNRIASVEDVGGDAYIAGLIDGLPRYSNIEHYAKIVKEKSTLRKLISAGNTIINNSYSGTEEIGAILEEAQSLVFKIADEGHSSNGFRPIADLGPDVLDSLAKMVDSNEGITGLSTGFTNIDKITAGFHGGDLVILAARPGMGKTSFVLNTAMNVARNGHTVGLFSLEMDVNQLYMRMLCSEARVNGQKIRQGYLNQRDFHQLAEAADRMVSDKVYIDDSATIGVMEIRSKSRRMKAEHGLDMLIIDYLQLMQVSNNSENRNLAIGEITRGCKALAKELNVPVILLSQLSRAVESRSEHRPMLSDLRESGNIEQDADMVTFLYRPEYYEPTEENKGLAEFIIAKNRSGPIDTANLVFLSDLTRFENYSPPIEEEF